MFVWYEESGLSDVLFCDCIVEH